MTGLDEFLPAPMPADEAEERISRIVTAVESIWPDLIALYQGRAWVSLGLPSWQALCDERMKVRPSLALEERRQVVHELTIAGLSTRAVGAALGVHKDTVRKDIAGGDYAPPATTGIDGKVYKRAEALAGYMDAQEDVRAANLRKGFANWAAQLHKAHLFDPAEIALIDPETGDDLEYILGRLNQWWADYQKARRSGLRIIPGGNA